MIVATPTYRDTRAAIEFLTSAFGFERHAVHEDDAGQIVHAELSLGDAMVMPAVADESDFGRLLTSVHTAERPTCGFYVVVEDVDAIYERAVGAGAEILRDLRDRAHGSREFTCRDYEGHVWVFGTYDPRDVQRAG